MTDESALLYQAGPFSVRRGPKGYEVFEDGVTAATLRATIGYGLANAYERATMEADRRFAVSRPENP